ncbi:MAG: hypothetical protein RIR95_868, partial [Pseudomonadota bacterium]
MTLQDPKPAKAPAQVVDVTAITKEARHYLLDEHALKSELMAKIDKAFHEGIEK